MRCALASVSSVRISRDLFEYTHDALREYSSNDVEAMALWAGQFADEEIFDVMAVKIPAQRAIRGETGLAVLIDGDELHRLNVWLHEHRLKLIAQIHTHPGDAYHSDLDDAIPVVATRGALSLVIPDFARGPADLDAYAVYRLGAGDRWGEVAAPVHDLIRVMQSATER